MRLACREASSYSFACKAISFNSFCSSINVRRRSTAFPRRGVTLAHLDQGPDLHPLFVPTGIPRLPACLETLYLHLHNLAVGSLLRELARRQRFVRREVMEESRRDADLRAVGCARIGKACLESSNGGSRTDDLVVACNGMPSCQSQVLRHDSEPTRVCGPTCEDQPAGVVSVREASVWCTSLKKDLWLTRAACRLGRAGIREAT